MKKLKPSSLKMQNNCNTYNVSYKDIIVTFLVSGDQYIIEIRSRGVNSFCLAFKLFNTRFQYVFDALYPL